MAFCPHCGKPTTSGTSFCPACGRALPEVGSPPPVAPLPAAPPPAYAPGPTLPSPPAPGQGVRPVGVTIIGVVTIVLGAAAAIGAVFLLLFSMMGAAWSNVFAEEPWGFWAEMGAGAFMVLALIGAIFVAAFAALAIAAGVGSLKGRPWAWMLTIVVAVLMGLNGLGDVAMQDVGGALGVLVAIVVVVYYFQPDVKAWFGKAT